MRAEHARMYETSDERRAARVLRRYVESIVFMTEQRRRTITLDEIILEGQDALHAAYEPYDWNDS